MHPRRTAIERFRDADARAYKYDDKLKADLEKHGLRVPLLVRADTMGVVDGRARLRSLHRLRVEMVPVVFFDFNGKHGSAKLKNLSALIVRITGRAPQ